MARACETYRILGLLLATLTLCFGLVMIGSTAYASTVDSDFSTSERGPSVGYQGASNADSTHSNPLADVSPSGAAAACASAESAGTPTANSLLVVPERLTAPAGQKASDEPSTTKAGDGAQSAPASSLALVIKDPAEANYGVGARLTTVSAQISSGSGLVHAIDSASAATTANGAENVTNFGGSDLVETNTVASKPFSEGIMTLDADDSQIGDGDVIAPGFSGDDATGGSTDPDPDSTGGDDPDDPPAGPTDPNEGNENEPSEGTETDPSTEPGNESGEEPGNEPGTEPGTEPGDEPGDEPGNEPGDEPGNEDEENTKPVWNYGEDWHLIYDGNGGLPRPGNTQPGSYTFNESAGTSFPAVSNVFERTGYLFMGWNAEPDGTGKYFIPGELIVYSDGRVLHDKLGNDDPSYKYLYAVWRPEYVTIEFVSTPGGTVKLDDGSAATDKASETVDIKTGMTQGSNPSALVGATATPDLGYNFGGWNASGDIEYQFVYNDETTQDLLMRPTLSADTIKKLAYYDDPKGWEFDTYHQASFQAQFVPNRYAVTVNANGGSGATDTLELFYTNTASIASLANFTREGWEFAGWSTEPGAKPVVSADADIRKLLESKALSYDNNSEVTLYAQWLQKSSNPNENQQGPSGNENQGSDDPKPSTGDNNSYVDNPSGSNQGGSNQGGSNQGGSNQGSSNQGASNQGGSNQGGSDSAGTSSTYSGSTHTGNRYTGVYNYANTNEADAEETPESVEAEATPVETTAASGTITTKPASNNSVFSALPVVLVAICGVLALVIAIVAQALLVNGRRNRK